jgi:hypothetical protein
MRRLAIAFGSYRCRSWLKQSIAYVEQRDHGTVADRNFVKTLIAGIEDGFSAINEEADPFNCHLLASLAEVALTSLDRQWNIAGQYRVKLGGSDADG